jgi:hypothetical protein
MRTFGQAMVLVNVGACLITAAIQPEWFQHACAMSTAMASLGCFVLLGDIVDTLDKRK